MTLGAIEWKPMLSMFRCGCPGCPETVNEFDAKDVAAPVAILREGDDRPAFKSRQDALPIATAVLPQSIALESREAGAGKEAVRHRENGDREFDAGNFEKAIEHYTQAIDLDSNFADAWTGRGGCHLRRGNLEEALSNLNQALELDANQLLAVRDRAEVRLRRGDIDGSIADYTTKLSFAPADGKALCGRGEARIRKGNREGAIMDLSMANRLGYPNAEELLQKAKQMLG